jgi:hypothetical protein
MEDQRSGKMLYADRRFSIGHESDAEQREFLNLISRRRILQLIGAADESSETSRDEPVKFTNTYGLGSERSIDMFIDHIGVDFKAREFSTRAMNGGYDGAFVATSKSLPTMWRGESTAFIWTSPSERASRH